jgi:signal transduction histidine kinase
MYSAPIGPIDLPADRLIALGRCALAAFCLFAIYLDPTDPARNVPAILAILATYFALACLLVWLTTRSELQQGSHQPILLIDVGVITVLMYLSGGPASPFFVLYIFVLMAAALRWNWRGAAEMTALLFVLLHLLIWDGMFRAPSVAEFELNRSIIRAIFLLVAGLMLASFAAFRERSRERLAALAAWPSPASAGANLARDQPLALALPHVSAVMEARRILVVWRQSEQTSYVCWAAGEYLREQRNSAAREEWVTPRLRSVTFASTDVSSRIYIAAKGSQTVDGPLIDPALQEEFQLHSVASAPFLDASCHGRVFILDRPHWTVEHLALTEIVAARIAMEIEHYILALQLETSAAARERLRITRDLHDGLLQNLTAAALQLKTATTGADATASAAMESVRKLLIEEQRQVRSLVEATRSALPQADCLLAAETRQLGERMQRLWGCEIRVSVEPLDVVVRRELGRQIDFIVCETVANAVQHGGASHVDVRIDKTHSGLSLCIANDGVGLNGAAGVYDVTKLATLRMGPASLRDRVTELGGSLVLFNAPDRVELQITLPV